MSEISNEVFPKEITWNALTEYVEDDGRNLENGMVVMLLAADSRYDQTNPAAHWANRWCRVTQLEKLYGSEVYPIIKFMGEYFEGELIERTHPADRVWLVKRDSIPNKVTVEPNLVKYSRLEDVSMVEEIHGSFAKFMQFHLDEFVNNPDMPELKGKITATVEQVPGGFVQFRLEGVV